MLSFDAPARRGGARELAVDVALSIGAAALLGLFLAWLVIT